MMYFMKRIYLDYAAATPLDSRVKAAMEPYLTTEFGNAGGLYKEGRKAKDALANARQVIARALGAHTNEIIFTSGGTESDNLAIFGSAGFFGRTSDVWRTSDVEEKNPPHIIITKFEHHAVLGPCEQLEKEGFAVTYLDVGLDGVVNPQDVQNALRPETILVSIMYANNEIGTIQPIAEIGKIIKAFRAQKTQNLASENRLTPEAELAQDSETFSQTRARAHAYNFHPQGFGFSAYYPLFHTDACQAAGYLDINVNNLGVDLMTINAAKIYGPKGVGVLYRRNGVPLKAQIIGGGQEMRMRGGTENIPLVVGFAKALEIAQAEKEGRVQQLTPLRDYFIQELIKRIPKVVLNGHPTRRLPNNVNVSILDIEGEALVLYLDEKGISFSTGSACTSESLDPSHVILALGKPYEFAHSSMRFTLGRGTAREDIDYVLSVLPQTVEWLRTVSPISVDMNAKSMSHPEAFAGQGMKVKAEGKSYK